MLPGITGKKNTYSHVRSSGIPRGISNGYPDKICQGFLSFRAGAFGVQTLA